MPLSAGTTAPDFTLATDSGKVLTLSSLRGKWVVLYAYPKDDTTSCTVEACGFRDTFPRFRRGKAVVLGISPDSVKKHQKFKIKYDLPFVLLSDPDTAVLQAYGVWAQKSMYGRSYMGVERTTFIIDPQGVIVQVFEKVRSTGHAEQVMTALKELQRALST